MQSTNKSDKLQCHYYEKTKMRTNDFTPMAGPFLCSTNNMFVEHWPYIQKMQ